MATERRHAVEATASPAPAPAREPIFVVGVSRSGTTLLAAMLNAHSRISCGPETFFFPRLARQSVDAMLADWPARATEFLTTIRLGGSDVRIHELFNRSRDEIAADLSSASPSVPSMLDALAGARARAEGKARWAEKTPNHLLYLEDIRRHYPTAPIVRIVRDPRDVALSLTKVPFGSTSKLANLYLWLERDERSWRFFERDPHSVTVRYEDLLSEPERELRKLCARIGEPFEPAMLSPATGAIGMMAPQEWWKQQVLRPLDRSRAAAWRAEYSAPETQVADVLCRKALARYGYPHAAGGVSCVRLFAFNDRMIEANEDLLAEAAAHDVALRAVQWEQLPLWRRATHDTVAFWGDLRRTPLGLGRTVRDRLRNATRLIALLALQPVRGRVFRIAARRAAGPPAGKLDIACGALIRLAAREVPAGTLFSGARVNGM